MCECEVESNGSIAYFDRTLQNPIFFGFFSDSFRFSILTPNRLTLLLSNIMDNKF